MNKTLLKDISLHLIDILKHLFYTRWQRILMAKLIYNSVFLKCLQASKGKLEIWDQGKNPKLWFSSYFHSSFSPFFLALTYPNLT